MFRRGNSRNKVGEAFKPKKPGKQTFLVGNPSSLEGHRFSGIVAAGGVLKPCNTNMVPSDCGLVICQLDLCHAQQLNQTISDVK